VRPSKESEPALALSKSKLRGSIRCGDEVIPCLTPQPLSQARVAAEAAWRQLQIFTDWEVDFLASIRDWEGALSGKQERVLDRLFKKASSI
jgi:hypothetical protein